MSSCFLAPSPRALPGRGTGRGALRAGEKHCTECLTALGAWVILSGFVIRRLVILPRFGLMNNTSACSIHPDRKSTRNQPSLFFSWKRRGIACRTP